MTKTIAISGKGGSGKTTVAAMMTRFVGRVCRKSTLAVDADPNACLGLALGIEPARTVADIRDDAVEKRLQVSPGMSKMRAFEYGIQQLVEESQGFDLLTMGHPEGPKCYCAANNMLRSYLDSLGDSYEFVVIDNEAGMEHLSRTTTNDVDWLYIVSEPTPMGTLTARRIAALARSLPISIAHIGVLWNKVDGRGAPQAEDGLPVAGEIPYDESVAEACQMGHTVFQLPDDNAALVAVCEVVSKNLGVCAAQV